MSGNKLLKIRNSEYYQNEENKNARKKNNKKKKKILEEVKHKALTNELKKNKNKQTKTTNFSNKYY